MLSAISTLGLCVLSLVFVGGLLTELPGLGISETKLPVINLDKVFTPDFDGFKCVLGEQVYYTTPSTLGEPMQPIGKIVGINSTHYKVADLFSKKIKTVPFCFVTPTNLNKPVLAMSMREVYNTLRDKMREHGVLGRYRLGLSLSVRYGGMCYYHPKFITISALYAMKATKADIIDTILHEIAHALTPGHGHDMQWRRAAWQIGCSGERCHSTKIRAHNWEGYCNCPGKVFTKVRLTERTKMFSYCTSCGETIEWERSNSF